MLWHEGIVHDAIACAAFLKFHPDLPKQGASVVTRPPHDATPSKHQRHSVEVTNAGHYLHIEPSTLETLTRSGEEASASRARNTELAEAIKEEDGHASASEPGPSTAEPSTSTSVVNVLPPALRALVALWDSLHDSDQLTVPTDKIKQPIEEVKEPEEPKVVSDMNLIRGAVPKKVEWKAGFLSYKTKYSVRCELCGGASIQPPLAAHMRHAHPGCRTPSQRGYDRAGIYKRAEAPATPAPTDMPPTICGQLAQGSSLWYVFCERCRDEAIKAASAKQASKGKACLNSNEGVDGIDYYVMKENAVFLLDLAPLNSESLSTLAWYEGSGGGPPTPPGSVWQPAPPFQCLAALGAAPRANAPADAARYHSLGRPTPPPQVPAIEESEGEASAHPRVHRSVSMGHTGARDLAHAAEAPLANQRQEEQSDALSGAGSSLLAQPSAALQKLVGCDSANSTAVSAFEPLCVDPDMLMKNPVISFVLAKRDLPVYRQKMDAAVRINTIRQYAFEALNWLLRSTTQPTCAHDVMWWFSTAIDKYARLAPLPHAADDHKDNVGPNDGYRHAVPTAATAVICPGGRAARGARAALHAFLGSVSALAPSLSPSSAATLQAVRCWALNYSQEDRVFLHRSQVFNVISKILSHTEDVSYDGDIVHNVWDCPDVTEWCDVTVSSRAGMAGSLVDGSTETFWESGDEDRNKAKWIQVAFAGGNINDRPNIVCVHVDNTRDTANKVLLVSFVYSGITGEMYHMHEIEVDPKVATWVCYTLPTCYSGGGGGSMRVRCELRGPEPSVRVRQVRVLGLPMPQPWPSTSTGRVLHDMAADDTLRVFRLLTSEVFGKLLEWGRSSSETGEVPTDDARADDSDLREHLVGILFAGNQLTSLQREVMTHIVLAIGVEAIRVRDDWETALLYGELTDKADQFARPIVHQQDNYCFEMLSLLLALSGSQVGRSLLAQQTDLLADLLALLHTGSERVQRQVISLLRRIISEIPPQKMLAAISPGSEINERITLLDHLLCYLGKAITVQMKVKGAGSSAPESVTMSSTVVQGSEANWFMKGETTKKHAHLVAKLLSDMAEDKVSPAWGLETKIAFANYAAQVAQINESDRRPEICVTLPTMWMSLAALCVCEQSYIDLWNGAESREARSREAGVEPRPYCANHDDGTTMAVIECHTCGALCTECDRFLHLNKASRAHHRQICKEEESAIRINIHEGCGRAKLFWLLLLVDKRTLKGLAEFRGMDTRVGEATEPASSLGPNGLPGVCRFCGARGNSGLLAISNICADPQCQEHGAQACTEQLPCRHLCGGVRGEPECLPCLLGCSGDAMLRQDADDMCMICFTDPLQAAPAIQLGCGHVFHLHCCKKVLSSKWIGPRITFSFAQCPICKENMGHWTLTDLLAPINRLHDEVQRKALMRLQYEGVAVPGSGPSNAQIDPANYAMERYAYYVCHKCEKAYFGGLARCEAESNGVWEPSELVCGACSNVASAKTCPKHGADFLEYKCRYCCSVAVFFCFGTSHFCNACHDDFQRVTNIPKNELPQCPAGPKCEQLPGSAEECPLHVSHPATGEEFALGCGVCRHAQVF